MWIIGNRQVILLRVIHMNTQSNTVTPTSNYDTDFVCEWLGICRQTVHNITKAGELKSFKIRKCRRYTGQALLDYVKAKQDAA